MRKANGGFPRSAGKVYEPDLQNAEPHTVFVPIIHAQKLLMNQLSERSLLLLLAAVQFTHILHCMILMPLGPQLMRELHIGPGRFSALVAAYTISLKRAGDQVLTRAGLALDETLSLSCGA